MKPEIRQGITKFSLISSYWTDLTYSDDLKVWKEDLKEQIEFPIEKGESVSLDMRIDKTHGGFGININSLDELEELSKYFRKYGFIRQLRNVYWPDPEKSRKWYTLEDEDFYLDLKWNTLFIYPFRYSDYPKPKLRELLLGLWRIGSLMQYKNNKFY